MQADNDNALPRTRAEAKALGIKRYFSGEPCVHGHIADRMVINNRCLVCLRETTAKWVEDNPDHILSYRKRIYAENKDELQANWASWYADNHERELDKKRERYANNREQALDYAKEYREENPDKVKEASAKWRADNPEKRQEAWQRWYAKNGKERDAKRRSTPKGKVDSAISRAIYGAIKEQKAGRKWETFVNFTLEELMVHLERRFQPGMTWGNYGKWHIDHKIPLAAHNYETPDDIDFKKAWALSNLQPLWAVDNIKKRDKLFGPFQPSLALAVNDNHHKEVKYG